MGELINFKLTSISILDEETNKIEFVSKGYRKKENDKIIMYFKHDHVYKFIVDKDTLEVNVDLSSYKFNCKEKTEALIRDYNYSYKASIITNKLKITDNLIEIDYTLDFVSFKGVYQIILKLS